MKQVEYTIKVPVIITWATGTPRGTSTRTFTITEDASLLGAARAIEEATDKCIWYEAKPPHISPNPAEMGWPVS